MIGRHGRKAGKTRTLRKAILGIGTVVALTTSVSPAFAAGATHTGTLHLYANPVNRGWSCIADRSIYLEAHEYAWVETLQGNPVNTRNIYLAAGWYTWSDCMIAVESANTGLWSYDEFSALTNSSGGEARMHRAMRLSTDGDYRGGVRRSVRPSGAAPWVLPRSLAPCETRRLCGLGRWLRSGVSAT